MGKVIDEAQYERVKLKLSKSSFKQVLGQTGLSESSLKRIQRSQNYADFKQILIKDRGPNYGKANDKWSTPTITPPKRKWWERLLNI